MFKQEIVVIIIMSFWIANFEGLMAKKENVVIERFEEVIKSPKDRRVYRSLKLSNELKILLISDPLTDKSAASMSIGVGSLNDTRGVPGLSNLVMHLTMMGSKLCMDCNSEFEKFVNARDGHLKLTSQLASQSFSFDVNPESLAKTLKEFAKTFLELFESQSLPEEVLDSGVRLLHERYLRHAKEDIYRIAEVERILSKQNHPFNHFHGGNEYTLYEHTREFLENTKMKRESLIKKVEQFQSFWYSSNIMKLVVLGAENLDKLEEMVVPLFKDIKDKNAPVSPIVYSYDQRPWGTEQMKKKLKIVSVSSKTSRLRVYFPVPDIHQQYETSPEEYFGYLLAHRGPGSLSSVLRRKNLCMNLLIVADFTVGIGVYCMTCDLTNDGLENVEEIIDLVFQYIRLIKRRGVCKEMYEEFRIIKEVLFQNFRPEDVLQPLDYVTEIAIDMQIYREEVVLSHKYLPLQWNQFLIEKFLTYFRPDNMNITIVSKSFSGIVKKIEKIYGTEYEIEEIPDQIIETWNVDKLIVELQLPPPNEFEPKNFELYKVDKKAPKDPHVIYESKISEIWFKQEDIFNSPKLHIELEIFSSFIQHSPFVHILWYLVFSVEFVSIVDEYLYSAQLFGFQINISADDRGILIRLTGYNDKMSVLLEKLISKMTSLVNDIDEDSFNRMRNEFIDAFIVSIESNHTFQLNWYTVQVQNNGRWNLYEDLVAAKNLHHKDMKIFLPKVFQRIFIRGLIHGNTTKDQAMKLVEVIEKPFHSSSGMLLVEWLHARVVEFTNEPHFIHPILNTVSDRYAYSAYFQFHTEPSNFYDVVTSVFFSIIVQSCQKIQPKQIDPRIWRVMCLKLTTFNVEGFIIMTMSDKQPQVMDSIVEEFLTNVPSMLMSIPRRTFEKLKKSLEAKDYVQPTDLEKLSEQYFHEIRNLSYDFKRKESEVQILRSLHKTDVLNFFEEMLLASSPRRCKLVMYVFPKGKKQRRFHMTDDLPAGDVWLEDINTFQSNLNLLPRTIYPKPQSSVPLDQIH